MGSRRWCCRVGTVCFVVALLGGSAIAGAALGDSDFVPLPSPASPQTAFAATRDDDGRTLDVGIEAEPLSADEPAPTVELGLAAESGKPALRLTEHDAVLSRAPDGAWRYRFAVPAAPLVEGEHPGLLRLAFSVAWVASGKGPAIERERYRHLGDGATHDGLSPNPADWAPIDPGEQRRIVLDRANRLTIAFDQPMDGKASVVIDDAQGRRVRNLVSGQPFAKGPQRVEWDGLDDSGTPVKPGAYAWESAQHPGIVPHYLFSFDNDGKPPWRTGSGADGWGPDHSTLVAAAADDRYSFFAGPVAESGYAIVAVDEAGVKRMSYAPPSGTGIQAVCLSADHRYLYAAHDGAAWGEHVDRSKPNWSARQRITLTRFNVEDGNVVDYAGKRFAVLATHEVGPGVAHDSKTGAGEIAGLSRSDASGAVVSLRGMALLGGKLYISDARAGDGGGLLVVDAATGTVERTIPLDQPGAIAADPRGNGSLLAVKGGRIVRLAPESGKAEPIVSDPALAPAGLAVDAAGDLLVSDAAASVVRVFDPSGKPIKTLGTPGGAYAGRYEPLRLVNPRALAMAANGWVWITEDRWNPKRLTAWDPTAGPGGKLMVEKFGPTSYGAPGAGFDPLDASTWVGQGAVWHVDLKTEKARPVSILKPTWEGEDAATIHWRFVHQDGRTFLIGFGMVTTVSELLPDGSMRSLALVASTHRYCFAWNWRPPSVFVEAYNRTYPNRPFRPGQIMDKGPGMLWVDRNGDGKMQADEVEFSTDAENFAGAGWGHDQHDLTLRLPARVRGRVCLVTLKPDGYNSAGAPKYPSLNAACDAGVPIDLNENEVESAVDRFGDLLVNSDPRMTAFSPEGRLLWTYPNRWSGVHGSHNAPLPETGVLQGSLFFVGSAPLDAESDVFVVNGNHGRFFALTSDGIYLDEFFKDVRTGGALDAYLIGGECFGGFFGQSKSDGAYYLQSGHTDYRIFRMTGLDQVRRSHGSIDVSPAQAVAAERRAANRAAEQAPRRVATIDRLAHPPAIDGRDGDWADPASLRWDKSGRFPVSVRAGYDDKNLYLFYSVEDNSPWVNHGKDPTLLFKTGDSVDLQLAADPAALPGRSQPAPGDERLLIAPYQGRNIAVLYRHRVADPRDRKDSVTFTSPWRSETVDSVRQLDNVKIAVAVAGGSYRVEAAIPLADLGLDHPEGKTYKADFGVIYGDTGGAVDLLRSYWSNSATNLVNDVPGEIMLSPNLWGAVSFAPAVSSAPAASSPRASRATEIICQGIAGNSGEQGASLVRFGPDSDPSGYGGIGVVCDRYHTLWDRGGRATLNRYALDGRLLHGYPIPDGSRGWGGNDQSALAGDTLALKLGNALYAMAVPAPGDAGAGGGVKPLHVKATRISFGTLDGWVAAADGRDLMRVNVATGATEPAGRLDANCDWIEMGPGGAIYAASHWKLHRFEGGHEAGAGWPRPAPGERPELIDGAWYGQSWMSTIRRYTADMTADPGVALGGMSGSFIGRLDNYPEISNGRGLARIAGGERGGLFAESGMGGMVHLLRWEPIRRQFEVVRRIGCVPSCGGLALDSQGRIWWFGGVWNWDDAPAAPLAHGTVPLDPPGIGQAVLLDDETMVAPAWRYGHPTFVHGKLDADMATDSVETGAASAMPAPGQLAATAVVREAGRQVMLIVTPEGKASAFALQANGRFEADAGPVSLTPAGAGGRWTSLAARPDGTLLAGIGGAIVEFVRDPGASLRWKETRRWTSAGADAFGDEVHIALDASTIWAADAQHNRVLALEASNAELRVIARFGGAAGSDLHSLDRPTTIAARADRAVVFDSGNQRLVKLTLR